MLVLAVLRGQTSHPTTAHVAHKPTRQGPRGCTKTRKTLPRGTTRKKTKTRALLPSPISPLNQWRFRPQPSRLRLTCTRCASTSSRCPTTGSSPNGDHRSIRPRCSTVPSQPIPRKPRHTINSPCTVPWATHSPSSSSSKPSRTNRHNSNSPDRQTRVRANPIPTRRRSCSSNSSNMPLPLTHQVTRAHHTSRHRLRRRHRLPRLIIKMLFLLAWLKVCTTWPKLKHRLRPRLRLRQPSKTCPARPPALR